MKCPARSGMSSRRSLSAGSFRVTTFQAVEQVLAEVAPGHQLVQVAVGGRDDPGVGLDGLHPAQGLETFFLEHAQQLDLELAGQVPHLVQEDGAARRQLETAGLVLFGVGKGPGLVAEELGFQQGIRQGAAVHGHKGPLLALGQGMDGPGEELLARARLAQQEHGGLAARDLGQDGEDAVQGHGPAHDVLEGVGFADLLAHDVDVGQVAEGLHPAHVLAMRVADGRGRDGHGHPLPVAGG